MQAPRAGDAGKGFAVVAEEVRNLAQRSANAAKDSAEKIRFSKELADNGMQVTENVSKSLRNINENAVKSADLMKDIVVSAKEQTTGLSQINVAVIELEKATQQNSAAAEESAAAAGELTSQAQILDRVVVQLKSIIYGNSSKAIHQVSQAEAVSTQRPKSISSKNAKVTWVQPATSKNGHHSHAKQNSESKNSAANLIPLDDNDFQGF